MTGATVVSLRVSLIAPIPVAAGLLIPRTALRRHWKVAPGTLVVGMYPKVVPLHTAGGVNVLVSMGKVFKCTMMVSLSLIGMLQVSRTIQMMVSR